MEKTKKFKFNILDVVIIIIALACAFGIFSRFGFVLNGLSGNNDKAKVTVIASNIRTWTAKGGSSVNIGDEFDCTTFNGKFGKVTDISFSPAAQYEEDENGHLIKSELIELDNNGDPVRSDMYITFESTGRFDDDGGFYAEGVNLIAPNSALSVSSSSRFLYITVLSVERTD